MQTDAQQQQQQQQSVTSEPTQDTVPQDPARRQQLDDLQGKNFDEQSDAVRPDGPMASSRFNGIALLEQALAGKVALRWGCGDKPAVKALQGALNDLGHDAGTVDGLWGPSTNRGVRAFQASEGLSVDGVIGKNTMTALDRADAKGGGTKTVPGGKENPTTGTGTTGTTGSTGTQTTTGGEETKWNPAYGTRKTWVGQTYDDYKDNLELKAASEHGGTKRKDPSLTLEQLFFIFPDMANDAAKDGDIMAKCQQYLVYLNESFALMQIDTTEAQAVFLAHSFVESDQFRKLTEAQTERYVDDPHQAKLYEHDLNQLYPQGSQHGRTINPTGDWSFIGRGPLQVTHRHVFVQTLAAMEKMAEKHEADGKTKEAATIREAHKAIAEDPKMASDPRYTFIFSTAYMKMAGGDKKAASGGKSFSGKDASSSWMTGGATDPKAALKKAAYERAIQVLKA